MKGSHARSGVSPLIVIAFAGALGAAPRSALAADPGYCAQYAQEAVHDAQVLSSLACFRGFDGRWHLNYQMHYGWCVTADYGAVNNETNYRRMRLAQCGYGG